MRNYKEEPLKLREPIPLEDLKFYYLVQNLNQAQCAEIFNCKCCKVQIWVRNYGLTKTNEQIQEMKRRNCLVKYGVDSTNKLKSVKEKVKKTCLKKYGVENVFKDINKIKNAVKRKYGVDNVGKLKVKSKHAITERHHQYLKKLRNGCDFTLIDFTKLSRNFLELPLRAKEEIAEQDLRYLVLDLNLSISFAGKVLGVGAQKVTDSMNQHGIKKSAELKSKQRKLALAQFGRKLKETNLQSLVGKISREELAELFIKQNKSISELCKMLDTTKFKFYKLLKHYGIKKSPDLIKELRSKTMSAIMSDASTLKERQEKAKQTNLKKYGCECPTGNSEVQKRIIETKKKNGTTCSSKPEQYLKKKLESRFQLVLTQHKTQQYPFFCDFYVPELDLYIEYQGHPGHGQHSFNSNSEEDIKLVETWKCKSENGLKPQYLGFINTWTVKDPLKRKIAKENNLNWIEFFTVKEFEEWFKILN